MKKKVTLKIASCLCGGVKIKIKGKLRHVINCHCLQCLKTHGNYAAYTSCPEINIKFTVLDSIEEGFKTRVILNGIKGINLPESNKALNEMQSKGVELL